MISPAAKERAVAKPAGTARRRQPTDRERQRGASRFLHRQNQSINETSEWCFPSSNSIFIAFVTVLISNSQFAHSSHIPSARWDFILASRKQRRFIPPSVCTAFTPHKAVAVLGTVSSPPCGPGWSSPLPRADPFSRRIWFHPSPCKLIGPPRFALCCGIRDERTSDAAAEHVSIAVGVVCKCYNFGRESQSHAANRKGPV